MTPLAAFILGLLIALIVIGGFVAWKLDGLAEGNSQREDTAYRQGFARGLKAGRRREIH